MESGDSKKEKRMQKHAMTTSFYLRGSFRVQRASAAGRSGTSGSDWLPLCHCFTAEQALGDAGKGITAAEAA